jgi:HTH-type transcriptional regulator/antitoxin HigA
MELLNHGQMKAARVIKTAEEYGSVLAEIEILMDLDPALGSAEADRLELLALLAEHYEQAEFPLAPADPIEAIRFRMDQQGLSPRDLVPYLGSRAKVSEVLSGKRELTLSMIRALHTGLGIPADALLGTGGETVLAQEAVEWERFPLREMAARGWIQATTSDIRTRAEELVRAFLEPLGPRALSPALYRKADQVRSARGMDPHALAAWTAHVLMRAQGVGALPQYQPGSVTTDFLRKVVQLSTEANAPRRVQDFLAENGIILIIEPHLPRTHLDGAAMMTSQGNPVVGLTVRYDRIDNFWFTLLHELVHIGWHLDQDAGYFYDDLETEPGSDPREREADEVAGEALIPAEMWRRSSVRVLAIPDTVEELANELRIHPAIVAGRVQHESRNYKLLHQMVGRGEVRACFPEVTWE